jgi:hypothetical protein
MCWKNSRFWSTDEEIFSIFLTGERGPSEREQQQQQQEGELCVPLTVMFI